MLSMQYSTWNQVGHICPKGPINVWCTDLQLLYTADTRWWPAALYVPQWAETSSYIFHLNLHGFHPVTQGSPVTDAV
jgi:hypothetical protein